MLMRTFQTCAAPPWPNRGQAYEVRGISDGSSTHCRARADLRRLAHGYRPTRNMVKAGLWADIERTLDEREGRE